MADLILDIVTFRNMPWSRGVEITRRASQALRNAIQESGLDPLHAWIRLGDSVAVPGGLTCALDFESTEPHGCGRAWTVHGLRFVSDERERGRLDGATLDYLDGLLAHGFVVTPGRRPHSYDN